MEYKKWCVGVAICLLLAACSPPSLDLTSDETYRSSLMELRASLDTDKEREILSAAVEELRAWRSEEHQQLMEVPTLTPAQEAKLEEMELHHDIQMHEMLHGKDLDGIAEAYRKLQISRIERAEEEAEREITQYAEAEKVTVDLLDLPKYQVGVGKYLSRRPKVRIRNGSSRALVKSLPGVICQCGKRCSKTETLELYALSLETGLEPGEDAVLEALDLVEDGERQLEGVDPNIVNCRMKSLTFQGESVLDDPVQLYFFGSSASERLGVEKAELAELGENKERLKAGSYGLERLVEDQLEWEARMEKLREEEEEEEEETKKTSATED